MPKEMLAAPLTLGRAVPNSTGLQSFSADYQITKNSKFCRQGGVGGRGFRHNTLLTHRLGLY